MEQIDGEILECIYNGRLDELSSRYNPKSLAISITNLVAEGLVDGTEYPYSLTSEGERVLFGEMPEEPCPTDAEMEQMARYYGEERCRRIYRHTLYRISTSTGTDAT